MLSAKSHNKLTLRYLIQHQMADRKCKKQANGQSPTSSAQPDIFTQLMKTKTKLKGE